MHLRFSVHTANDEHHVTAERRLCRPWSGRLYTSDSLALLRGDDMDDAPMSGLCPMYGYCVKNKAGRRSQTRWTGTTGKNKNGLGTTCSTVGE